MHILGTEFEKEKIVLFLHKYGPLLLVTVLAAALRFYRLGRYGLWLDEIFSTLRAEQGLRYLLFQRFRLTDFFIFLELLVGNSEFIIRFYAAFFGVLGVVALYICCEKLWGKRLAFFSSLLLTFNYFHVYYSQDARYYAVVFFFAVLSYFFLFQLLREKDLKFLVYKLLIYLLGVNTHPTFYMLIASEGLFLFFVFLYWVVKDRKWFFGWRVFGADLKAIYGRAKEANPILKVGGILLALLAVFFLYKNFYSPGVLSKLDNFRWFPTDPGSLPERFSLPPRFYWKLFREFSGLGGFYMRALVTLVLLGFGFSFVKKRYYLGIFGVFLFSVPVFLIWSLNPHRGFTYRYVMFILPLWIVFLGEGFEAIFEVLKYLLQNTSGADKKLHWIAWAVVFFLVVFLFILPSRQSLSHRFRGEERYAWREQAEILQREYEDGDVIVSNNYDALQSLPYYLMKLEGKSVASHPVIQKSVRLRPVSAKELKVGRYRIIFNMEHLIATSDGIEGKIWVSWFGDKPPEIPYWVPADKYSFSELSGSLTRLRKIPDKNIISSYDGPSLIESASLVASVSYNSQYDFVQPVNFNQQGVLEYEVEIHSERGPLYICYSAYVFYEGNYVRLWYSPDGENYELLDELRGSVDPVISKEVLKVPWSTDLSTLYLRIELFTNSDTSVVEFDSRIRGFGVYKPL